MRQHQMNANRHHANRPSMLTAMDRARQTAALARHDAEVRRTIRNNRIKAALAWGFILALTGVFFAPVLRAVAQGVL